MRILFAGSPELAVPTLEALVASQHEIVGVLTRDDAALGRKRVLTETPVAAAARALEIPVFKRNRIDSEVEQWVSRLDADLGVIVAFGSLIRDPLLSTPRLGWINLHFSHLPKWRGAAPVQRALMSGENNLGMTVFRLVPELDAGPILSQDSFKLDGLTTASEALRQMSVAGTTTVLRAIDVLVDDADAGQPQQGEPSYAHKLYREDGRLDPTQPHQSFIAHWAGVSDEPGAYLVVDEQAVKVITIGDAQPEHILETLTPGQIEIVNNRAFIRVADASVELVRVQPFSKQAMPAADWLRGRGGKASSE